jgi:hypothetical protein
VAPLRLGGLRGKKSTPSAWLGGTGELDEIGKQEQEQEQEQLGAGAAGAQEHCCQRKDTGMNSLGFHLAMHTYNGS